MRCPVCGVECRTDSGTDVLKFICRSKQCPQFGQVLGEKDTAEENDRESAYPKG